jgi:hypothetical protein
VEEPDGHFEMAQGAGLAGAGLQSALDGGADFHVFVALAENGSPPMTTTLSL